MIVSGFTQRTSPPTDEDLAEFPGLHTHCFRCRLVNCTHPVDNVTSCAITSCRGCGWKFHECKAQEHSLSCLEERVACINAAYGCPHILKRALIPKHLPVCPASVVHCSESWTRTVFSKSPMHAKDKGEEHSFPPHKLYIDCGQMDVALAMRDQRMLMNSLKAPAKQRNTLRNPLTTKYPAASFTQRCPSVESDNFASNDTSQTVSDDETDAPDLWDSISSKLFCLSKDTTENIVAALDEKKDINLPDIDETSEPPKDLDTRTFSQGITPHEREACAASQARSETSLLRGPDRSAQSRSVSVVHDMGGSQLHKILGYKLGDEKTPEISLHEMLGVSVHLGCIKYISKPASMCSFICAQNFRRDQYLWHFKNIHEEIIPTLSGYLEHRCPLAVYGCTFSFPRLIPSQPNTELHFSSLQESFGVRSLAQPDIPPPTQSGTPDSKESSSAQDSGVNAAGPAGASCPIPPSISDLGKFDQDFEQLKVKDSAKDNVKDDSGSERSPPLVSVQPVVWTGYDPDSKVLLVYNMEETVESPSTGSRHLTDLPFEVLQHIAKQLDSFSLCNFSLSCRLLREVSCSLLDDRGLVLLNWERQKIGDKISWKVTNKRWIFSTSFEPITSWIHNDDHMSILEHLKVCPFNKDRLTHDANQFCLINQELPLNLTKHEGLQALYRQPAV